MSPTNKYLIIYALIVISVVLSILFLKRGQGAPVRLRLKKEKPTTPVKVAHPGSSLDLDPSPIDPRYHPTADAHQQKRQYQDQHRKARYDRKFDPSEASVPREMSLNVLFNWNGHAWDAYEVLGLPAGSSREAVAAAFQTAQTKCDPDSLPFLRAAHDAIMRSASTRF